MTARFQLRALFAALLALLVLAAVPAASHAQKTVPPPEAKASPLGMAYTSLDDGTYLKVTYHSPRKKGRTLFGNAGSGALEPYNEVWRLGANEATEITLTDDVSFGGKRLAAGTYSLFAIPNPNAWTIIVNRGLGQWGDYAYDEGMDVLRVEVPVETMPESHEAFTIGFEDGADAGSKHLGMMWDRTKVVVPIEKM